MIEYTDGRRTQAEIRQMFLALIQRDRQEKADKLRRKILKQKI